MSADDRALQRVVELSEGAKSIRRYAFEVSLSALGAIVRSTRSEVQLRGFKEVASQMRDWSRELERAVADITVLTSRQVRIVSDLARRTRLASLLERASIEPQAALALEASRALEQRALRNLRGELRGLGSRLEEALHAIVQLGMMATVLSRAALIEAASGSDDERRELTIASQEFRDYASQVNDAIANMLVRHRSDPS